MPFGPTTDPVRWRILDAIVVALAALRLDTDTDEFFFAPDEVSDITPPLMEYLGDRDPTQTQTVYGLWVEDEDFTEKASSRQDSQMRVFLQAATRYTPPEDALDPFVQRAAGVETEEETRSKLVHDVQKFIA